MDPSRVIYSAFTPELSGKAGIKFSPRPLQSTRRRRTIQAFNRPTMRPSNRPADRHYRRTDRRSLAHSLARRLACGETETSPWEKLNWVEILPRELRNVCSLSSKFMYLATKGICRQGIYYVNVEQEGTVTLWTERGNCPKLRAAASGLRVSFPLSIHPHLYNVRDCFRKGRTSEPSPRTS